jgi:hypothetical protein
MIGGGRYRAPAALRAVGSGHCEVEFSRVLPDKAWRSVSSSLERTADVSPSYPKYLLSQALIGALINFVLNGAIGWILYSKLSEIPLYGPQSIAGDVVATSFLLPVLVCLIATPLIRNEVRMGRIPAENWIHSGSSRVAHLLRNLLLRAVVVGLAALLVSPVTIWTIDALGVAGLGLWSFLLFKAAFAAALAGVISPIVAAWALADGLVASASRPSPTSAT